jgi:hypothetical protein
VSHPAADALELENFISIWKDPETLSLDELYFSDAIFDNCGK